MVLFPVEFLQMHFEILAYGSEYFLHPPEVRGAEYLSPPLGDEHQVSVKQINNAAALSDFHQG
jgi:hypothetical protein